MRTVAIAAAAIAGVVSASVAIREHDWRQAHPYQLGPSGYIVALGIAGVCLAIAVGWVIRAFSELERRYYQHLGDEARRRSSGDA